MLKDNKRTFAVEGLGEFDVVLHKDDMDIVPEKKILLSLRPEKIEISKKELSGFSNVLKGMVKSIIYHGRSTQYNVELSNGRQLHVFEQNEKHFVTPEDSIDYDDAVYLYWQKENAVILEQ